MPNQSIINLYYKNNYNTLIKEKFQNTSPISNIHNTQREKNLQTSKYFTFCTISRKNSSISHAFIFWIKRRTMSVTSVGIQCLADEFSPISGCSNGRQKPLWPLSSLIIEYLIIPGGRWNRVEATWASYRMLLIIDVN